jgi:tetratricopeptide (TPR) repeat protein
VEESLAGKRIGFAGRLLTCDRQAARRLVHSAGGRVARGLAVDFLVVGNGGRAPAAPAARTLTEAQFLDLVRASLRADALAGVSELERLVPASEASRLYPRITWARRRSLARHGLVRPVALANGVGYRFADLRVLRAVDDLIASGLSLQQAIQRVGPRLHGQLEFRFPKARIAPRPRRADLGGTPTTAEAWFDMGACADRDRATFPAAIAAYQRALEVDPHHVPSLINLGNVHYELGEFGRARDLYARAAVVDGENPRTHFNLGNACDELGDLLGALRAYRRAIALWPGYADAHFNLALVAEKLESWQLARLHWRRFLDLEPRSDWAAVARSHLEDATERCRTERARARAAGKSEA